MRVKLLQTIGLCSLLLSPTSEANPSVVLRAHIAEPAIRTRWYPCRDLISSVRTAIQSFRTPNRSLDLEKNKTRLLEMDPANPSQDRSALWRQIFEDSIAERKSLQFWVLHPDQLQPVEFNASPEALKQLLNAITTKSQIALEIEKFSSETGTRAFSVTLDELYLRSLKSDYKIRAIERAELQRRIAKLQIADFENLKVNSDTKPSEDFAPDLRNIRDLSRALGTKHWDQIVQKIIDFAIAHYTGNSSRESQAVKVLRSLQVLDERLDPERYFKVEMPLNDKTLSIHSTVDASAKTHSPLDELKRQIANHRPIESLSEASNLVVRFTAPAPKGLNKKIKALKEMAPFDVDAFLYLRNHSDEHYRTFKRLFIARATELVKALNQYSPLKDNDVSADLHLQIAILASKMKELADQTGDTEWEIN